MKAKVIKSKPAAIAAETDAKVINFKETKERKASQSLAENIAEDKFQYRNQFFPDLAKAFPDCRDLHYVDRYFPYAKTGPIAFDEANRLNTPLEIEGMKLKKKVLAKNGVKYVLLMPDTTELEALEQLS